MGASVDQSTRRHGFMDSLTQGGLVVGSGGGDVEEGEVGGGEGLVDEVIAGGAAGVLMRNVVEFDGEQGLQAFGIDEDEVDGFAVNFVVPGITLIGAFGEVEEFGQGELAEDAGVGWEGAFEDTEKGAFGW